MFPVLLFYYSFIKKTIFKSDEKKSPGSAKQNGAFTLVKILF